MYMAPKHLRSQYSFIHIDNESLHIVEVPPPPSYAKNHHVRFAMYDNEVHEIPHINDLSPEEKDQVWYSFDELKQIISEAKKILDYIDNENDKEKNKKKKRTKKNPTEQPKKNNKIRLRGILFVIPPILIEKGILKKKMKKREPILKDEEMIIDHTTCIRGLEKHTTSELNRKESSNRMLLSTILTLQRLKQHENSPHQVQLIESTNDVDNIEEAIANVCRNFSSKDVMEAIQIAKQDEIDACNDSGR